MAWNKPVTAGMERVGRGLWLGIAPKIGSTTLVIDVSHRTGDWEFDYQVAAAVGMLVGATEVGAKVNLDEVSIWFQCVERGQWVWSHGLVNGKGVITQIG